MGRQDLVRGGAQTEASRLRLSRPFPCRPGRSRVALWPLPAGNENNFSDF